MHPDVRRDLAGLGQLDHVHGRRVAANRSTTQRKVLTSLKMKPKAGAKEMSRLSFALLLVTVLMLTAYFRAEAWRLSDDSHMDVTGHITPTAK
jgi:hypothetical protein